MKAFFPNYADLTHYWDVEDLDIWNPERAMNRIEELVTIFFTACIRGNQQNYKADILDPNEEHRIKA